MSLTHTAVSEPKFSLHEREPMLGLTLSPIDTPFWFYLMGPPLRQANQEYTLSPEVDRKELLLPVPAPSISP